MNQTNDLHGRYAYATVERRATACAERCGRTAAYDVTLRDKNGRQSNTVALCRQDALSVLKRHHDMAHREQWNPGAPIDITQRRERKQEVGHGEAH